MLNFESKNKNEYVLRSGEYGTKFYIILRGKVSVRVQTKLDKQFTFRHLLEYLQNEKEWIIK